MNELFTENMNYMNLPYKVRIEGFFPQRKNELIYKNKK